MKLQLIMLATPVLVSDEEIKPGDIVLCASGFIHPFEPKCIELKGKKIIAGIPELPSIDFSALSEEDCKKIGWINIEKLADEFSEQYSKDDDTGGSEYLANFSFKEGFKTAQSLNQKKFSEYDMRKAMHRVVIENWQDYSLLKTKEWINNYLQSLSQPKVFDVIANLSEDKKHFFITQII